jgi:poly [ADP-ribose] polymerase 2/3/4
MDYATSIRVRTMTSEVLDSKAEQTLRQEMDEMQHVRRIVLAYFKNNDEGLQKLLLENDIDMKDLGITRNRFDQALFAADSMLRGVASRCPHCKNRGLVRCHGRVTCKGFLESSSVRCPFRTSQDKHRKKFLLPDEFSDLIEDDWIDQKKNKKRRRGKDLGSMGELLGLKLQTATAKSPSRKKIPKPPKRDRPEIGSPILRVHRNYEQTGREHLASIVIDQDGTTVYNAILNQVDLSRDQNRYYVLQLLKVRDGKTFRYELFRTEGRTGRQYEEEYRHTGVMRGSNFKVYDFGDDLKKSIVAFKDWFKKKTGGRFEDRHALVQRPGTYAYVELSTKNIEKKKKKKKRKRKKSLSLSLNERKVYEFVSMISDDSTLEFTMKEAGLNIKELPLGALSLDLISKGREILISIEKVLSDYDDDDAVISLIESDEEDVSNRFQTTDDMKKTIWKSKLEAQSTLFYTLIPSKDVSVINTKSSVQQKLALLDILEDVLNGSKLIEEDNVHEKDDEILAKYRGLKCKLVPLETDDPVQETIETAFINTSRNKINRNGLAGFPFGSICNVFEVMRTDQKDRGTLRASKKKRRARSSSKHRLLWHGAPMGVIASILKSGLRIMPGSGGRLGKGIYLADMAAKSGFYAKPTKDGLCCLFLCEADCGRPFVILRDSTESSRRTSAPKRFGSVNAHGIELPDPKGDVTMSFDSNDVTFSTGVSSMRSLKNNDNTRFDFDHNEYVVYEEKRVRIRYVVTVSTKMM